MKRVAFIINPIAGVRKNLNIAGMIHQYLDTSLFEYNIFFTEHKGHAEKLALDAVKQGYDIIAASGGDGTMNEIARALVNTQVVLAILPLGSGNGLARHLGIPLHIPEALKILNACKSKRIDTGTFNGALFLSNAGTGFVACVAEAFDHNNKVRGFWGYSIQTLKNFFSYKPVEYTITIDNKVWSGYFFAANICNSNQFGYEAKVAPDAVIDDGKLEIVLVKKTNLFLYVLLMIQLFFGNVYNHPQVIHVQGKNIKIGTKTFAHFQVDGEPMGKNLSFEALLNPLSLSVICP